VILRENFVALFPLIGFAFFLVPALFIFLSGVLEMQSVSENVTALNEAGVKTIDRLWAYLGNNILRIVISDLVGLFVGFFVGLVVRRSE
jgi:ABC-type sugar transport system permease subunit